MSHATTLNRAVYLVEGCSGQYSDHSTWIVNGWLSQESAEREASRLNELSRQLEAEKSALGNCPNDHDSHEWDKWWEGQRALEDKYRALTGDESIGMSPFSDTDYAVRITELKDG